MFDLPVVEKADRRAATTFRNFLLDEGFSMGQMSIYYRLLSGKEAVEALSKRIERQLPKYGVVQLLTITDKQFENMRTYESRASQSLKKTDQLVLF